jgi:hypothetical protein
MRLYAVVALVLLMVGTAMAAQPSSNVVDAHGVPDGSVPGWTINSLAPSGWTKDCCTYASAIGVNYVLYQGDWTGKPDRVIVLNVWPSKLPTLDAELQDDLKHYLQVDPAGKVSAFPVKNPSMSCQGVMYTGSDHVNDVVVFCDPGKMAGIRYSWSMTIGQGDTQTHAALDAFRQVVEHSTYATYILVPGSTSKAATH